LGIVAKTPRSFVICPRLASSLGQSVMLIAAPRRFQDRGDKKGSNFLTGIAQMIKNSQAGPLILATTSLLTSSLSGPPAEPVSVVGQITDARTGQPIENVQVVLEGERIAVVTNREGEFLLPSRADAAALEVKLLHPCYHTIRVEIGTGDVLEGTGRASASSRRIDLGLPFNYEKYVGYAPPLGGCR
jgi:hypothetical protein